MEKFLGPERFARLEIIRSAVFILLGFWLGLLYREDTIEHLIIGTSDVIFRKDLDRGHRVPMFPYCHIKKRMSNQFNFDETFRRRF